MNGEELKNQAQHFIDFFGDNALKAIEITRNNGSHTYDDLFEMVENMLKEKVNG